jgi:capsular exopolysaccharide synthesis family protein
MPLFGKKSPPEILEPARPEEGKDVPIKHEELVLARGTHGSAAEQFRRLRNSIQALNPDGAARSVLVTSAVDGEGKTVATLNLAMALAEIPQTRVLVVDADFRAPSIERYLGLPRRQGFSELLRGTLPLDQAIRATSFPRLDLVGAGARPENPAEILHVDRIKAVFSAFKRRYDYVFVDSSATLAVSHATVLGPLVDGVLFVVRLGGTPKQLVEEAYRMIENLGGNMLGTCLTGTDPKEAPV